MRVRADRDERPGRPEPQPPAGRDEVGGDGDEWSVVARAQDGDLAAFETLVDRYQRPLFGLAWRMLDDRGEAEDVVQEALITAWRRMSLLASPGAFVPWLYKVTTNRCFDVLRRRTSRRTDVVADETLTAVPDGVVGQPEAEAQLRAEQNEVVRLLDTLTDDQRACWLLREVHGRSYAEIASTLGTTETAVRGRLSRARTQLAGGMRPWR